VSASLASSRAQRDADAVLRGADPGAPIARDWKLGRPAMWSAEQRARLESVSGRFAGALEVHLAAATQGSARVQPVGIESLTGAEVVAALDRPTAAFAIGIEGGDGPGGLIDFGAGLALEWVERMLGGPASAVDAARPLTTFEQALVRGLAERSLALLGEGWSTLAPTRFACRDFHADPALAPLDPAASLIVAHFQVALGAVRRDVLVALPAVPFATLGERAGAAGAGPRSAALLASQLQRTSADVRVRFPDVRVTARSLSALQAGQVLYTRLPTDGAFEVRVNGRPKFRGQIGQVRRHLGVRITETVKAADEAVAARPLEGRIL